MLETISDEIHMKRGDIYGDAVGECPVGPREPGVGAENYTDYSLELERHDLGMRSISSEESEEANDETKTLEELRNRVRRLAARPVEGGASSDFAWETELNETVNRLDQMLMLREKAQQNKSLKSTTSQSPQQSYSFTPEPVKKSYEHLEDVVQYESDENDDCDNKNEVSLDERIKTESNEPMEKLIVSEPLSSSNRESEVADKTDANDQ